MPTKAQNQAKANETRAFDGANKVCLACSTRTAPRFRKCINPKCGGDRFRYETDRESNARLQRHDAEQRAQDALLTELTGGAV